MDLTSAEDARAINVYGNGMLPLYRHGDQLIVSAKVPIKTGDRIILEMKDSSRICGTLVTRSDDALCVCAGGLPRNEILVKLSEVVFLGRIIWASQ